jgi:hypothetical protein
MLEGQATAEQKRDEIVPPEVPDVAPLLDQFALAVDAVGRQVGAQVCPRRGASRLWITGWSDLHERAGRGIARAESREIRGRLLRQDDEVGLLVGGTVPSRRAAPGATARGCPQLTGEIV